MKQSEGVEMALGRGHGEGGGAEQQEGGSAALQSAALLMYFSRAQAPRNAGVLDRRRGLVWRSAK